MAVIKAFITRLTAFLSYRLISGGEEVAGSNPVAPNRKGRKVNDLRPFFCTPICTPWACTPFCTPFGTKKGKGVRGARRVVPLSKGVQARPVATRGGGGDARLVDHGA